MTDASSRVRPRAPWIAVILAPLLALAGLLVPTAPAAAAPGDVADATLSWGVKESFRTYITGPIAHGSVSADAVSTEPAYGWSDGSGTATGAVAYPGSLHFRGHEGFGVPAGEFALDLTFSNVEIRLVDATTAELIVDARSRGFADPSTFVELTDVVLATLDLAAGTDASTADAVAWSGVPATLTETGAPAFGGFYAAGTALDPVSFTWPVEQEPAPGPEPSLTVTPSTDLDPDGATITVTGTDFATEFSPAAPYYPVTKAGFYAQIGWIDATWKPSDGAPSSARSNAYSVWVQGDHTDSPYLQWDDHGDGTADFTWTLEIDRATLDAKTRDGATLAAFTVGAAGTTQPANEHAVPLTFADDEPIDPDPIDPDPIDPDPNDPDEPGPTPTPPPAPRPGAGSLTWGVKQSFREYVTGPIAHGSISADGVGGSNGEFVFPQTGSATSTLAGYSGAVSFRGHDGVLALTIADPQVRFDSATAGTLLARVNGTRVPFATLALGSAFRSVGADGSIRYTGVPAALTAQGASAFSYEGSAFYPAGTTLDPVSFVVGSAGSSLGGPRVVAASSTTTAPNSPDATPPATDGITVTGGRAEGDELTATASGFQPGEEGILVVVYSEPTVLADDARADADGVVTWSGELPRGLTGEHTLTFQGSVDRGVVLDIAAAMRLACTVDDATLLWGFKESFRAHIDGSIANGSWEASGGATYATPLFTWSGGSGGVDADTDATDVAFAGAVRFTGHGGVLDTTVANPRVVVDDGGAVLLLDVRGTTQDGTPVDRAGVEFAELDLEAGSVSAEGATVRWSEVPATLTADGAVAFGTYPAGEALDAIELELELDPACAPATATAAESDPDADVTGARPAAASPLPWILGAIAALVAIGVVVALLVLRRRRA